MGKSRVNALSGLDRDLVLWGWAAEEETNCYWAHYEDGNEIENERALATRSLLEGDILVWKCSLQQGLKIRQPPQKR